MCWLHASAVPLCQFGRGIPPMSNHNSFSPQTIVAYLIFITAKLYKMFNMRAAHIFKLK